MCELLGMSFNFPVRPTFSFTGFRHGGESNPHGWGLAYYPDKSAQIIREPLKAGKSELSKFLKDYQEVKSKIFISHVRRSSAGEISHKDTHPFRIVECYNTWPTEENYSFLSLRFFVKGILKEVNK